MAKEKEKTVEERLAEVEKKLDKFFAMDRRHTENFIAHVKQCHTEIPGPNGKIGSFVAILIAAGLLVGSAFGEDATYRPFAQDAWGTPLAIEMSTAGTSTTIVDNVVVSNNFTVGGTFAATGSITANDYFIGNLLKSSSGDIDISPAGDDVSIDGGLTVGSTTDAGDNNLKVIGTATIDDRYPTYGPNATTEYFMQAGKATVGDAVTFDVSFSDTPVYIIVGYNETTQVVGGDPASYSSESASGFTVGGYAGATVDWLAYGLK